ncbi:hypothetical protein [Mycobacteroides abscessus]|uniref:hypothetical protein n=1 Tax=Mycobacteroides abscessus TaxID=36809 RepID=UPI00092C659B|nr:hypothetical protein [Mycobacteroides abscessus]SIJ98052.1 Uncharacterised protein [Mycobacteroides abscessus subsp. abscessus]
MSDATQLAPAQANTPPFLVEHIANGFATDTLVNDELVVVSWPSANPRYGDQICVAPWMDDGDTWSGFLVADEHAARKARTAIARTYIAGLKAGAR